ncbi:hypothetical protein CXB51_019282 [Gossypium anomalum]|uniref:Integrase catalytic domain-containing protein n=1 Tax=Gossypium anomalum TaxID=47600 RepID=A0A8J6CWD4_9ROSI|nr:hypothetical protein CXB51_019282 [Gossypium anomalum]
MLAVLLAVKKWHPYVVGRRFQIRTDQQSLKILADRQAITPFQQRWEGPRIRGIAPSMCGEYFMVLRRKRKAVVGNDIKLKRKLFECFNCSPLGGHSGARYQSKLYCLPWSPIALTYPDRAWEAISIDFIEGLPVTRNKNTILVVVDRLTKYRHFLPLSHPFTAITIAQEYLIHVYKLHGIPETIVSDRDKIFVSNFWQELFKRLGAKLCLSTAYHPQTNGQTEVLKRCLGGYLRCMVSECPKEWVQWLPLAEWWYNTTHHSAIYTIPYEALLWSSTTPTLALPSGSSNIATVDRSLHNREVMRKLLHFHLKRAQERMRQIASKKRSDRKAKVGQVPYKLTLPVGLRIHPTFHVSQLKKYIGKTSTSSMLPVVETDGVIDKEPMRILDRRVIKMGNQAATEVLVEWFNTYPEDSTWEDLQELQ